MNNLNTLIQKRSQWRDSILPPINKVHNLLTGILKIIMIYFVINILFISVSVAQSKSSLPAIILKLVPPGTELISQNFNSSPTMAVAEFTSNKSIANRYTVEYHLVIRAFDNSSPSWKMRESAYRKQMEDRIESHRAGLAPESANQGMFTADPVEETKYSWGSGLTQRLLNHPPNANEFVTYNCAYFGIMGGIVFELYVNNLTDSPEEANKWAKDVSEAVANLTVSNIGN
jgi:hypothetical protein